MDTRIESLNSTEASAATEYQRWHDEICYAEKEMRKYWDRCQKIIKLYTDERNVYDENQKKFNIYAANVDSVLAAVYAAPPKTEVMRRFNDVDDDVSRTAAMILERCLEQDLDEPGSSFHDVVKSSIFDRLTAAMGQVWLRIEEEIEEATDPFTGQVLQNITEREVVIEHVHYSDFLWSPCRVYADRRWVARRVYMDRDSLVKRFGSDLGKRIPLDYAPKQEKNYDTNNIEHDVVQKAMIYEIWDRNTKTVVWLSKAYPASVLDKRQDFLHLSTFEPCPPPLFGSLSTSKCIPIPDYDKCKDQYEDLNEINNRLSKLVQAMKVMGLYDKRQPAIANLFTQGAENKLLPVDNWNVFAERGGLKGLIDWVPLEAQANAIIVLRQEKEAKKQEIYELSGYSDILRGATKATETATAQKLKANFASGKIQKIQNDVENFVRDIMFIKAEMLCKHFPPQYLVQCSNIMSVATAQPLIGPALQLLQNPLAREYRVSIKPESMAQVDYASEKSDRMELLSTVGTYIEKALPVIQAQPIMADLIIGMLKFGVAGFKAGKEFEGLLDVNMERIRQYQQQVMQQPQQPSPEQIKAEMEQQKMQMEMQHTQQIHNLDVQGKVVDLQVQREKNAMQVQHQAHMNELAQQLRGNKNTNEG